MFGLKKKGPTRPFTHADNCKILKPDPGVEIKWSEVETGHWRAICQCGSEDVHEELADRRVRRDPYDRPPSATLPSDARLTLLEAFTALLGAERHE